MRLVGGVRNCLSSNCGCSAGPEDPASASKPAASLHSTAQTKAPPQEAGLSWCVHQMGLARLSGWEKCGGKPTDSTRQTHHRLHAAITCARARVPRASDGSALRVLRLADGWPVPTAGERLHGVMARLLEAVHPLVAGTEGEVNRPDPRLPTISESVEQSDPADDFSVLDHFVLRGIFRRADASA